MRTSTLLVATLTLVHNDSVLGHAYLSWPEARNVPNNYEPQSLAAGGPGIVLMGDSYRHGLCGNKWHESPQNWNVPVAPKATYTQGSVIDVSVVVTAHHLGYFDLQLCDSTDIDEACFSQHKLERPNCDASVHDCTKWWKPLLESEKSLWPVTANGGYIAQTVPSGAVLLKTQFQLPTDVHCTNCVLRWHYYTTNSCPPENHSQDPLKISEEFWNCADIRIDAAQGPDTTKNTLPTEALMHELPLRQPQNLMGSGFNEFCPPEAIGEYDEYASVQQCYNPTGLECEYGTAAPSPRPTTSPTLPPITTSAGATQTDGTTTPSMSADCGTCVGCLHPGDNGWRACYTDWSPITCAMNAQYGYDSCYPDEEVPEVTASYTTSTEVPATTLSVSSSPTSVTTMTVSTSSASAVSSSEMTVSTPAVSTTVEIEATPTYTSTTQSISIASSEVATTDSASSSVPSETPNWIAGPNTKFLSCAESQCSGCLRIGWQCDGMAPTKRGCDAWVDAGYLWCEDDSTNNQ